MRDFFWFDLSLEDRAEILKKKIVGFLVDWKTPKGHFEINWTFRFANETLILMSQRVHKEDKGVAQKVWVPRHILKAQIFWEGHIS